MALETGGLGDLETTHRYAHRSPPSCSRIVIVRVQRCVFVIYMRFVYFWLVAVAIVGSVVAVAAGYAPDPVNLLLFVLAHGQSQNM